MFVRVQSHCYSISNNMEYEFEDYRKKGPPPQWLEWTPISGIAYVFQWFMYVWLIPFLLGLMLTPIGILFTTVLLDYVMYKRAVAHGHY